MTETDQKTSDHVVTTFGRFNPPSVGHKKLIDTIKNHAEKHGADHMVFASQSQDAKKNPLSHKDKVSIMKKMFTGTNIHDKDDVKNIIDVAKNLHKKGYKKATFFVGSDRLQEMSNLLHKYNGKEYNFDNIEVKSAGERDEKAKGVEGASGTKLREFVKNNDFKSFQKGAASKEHAKELFNMVKKGMKLENFNAIFVLGNIGSGKNVLINPLIEKYENLAELNIPTISNAIKGGELDIELGTPMIINALAENLEEIAMVKIVLEEIGYNTSAAFVWTTNDESKSRNDARILAGEKTISEERRLEKYDAAIKNIPLIGRMFGGNFLLFNNSANINELSEEQKTNFALYHEDSLYVIESFMEENGFDSITESEEYANFISNFIAETKREFDAHKALTAHASTVRADREKKKANLGMHNFFDYQSKRETKPAKPLRKEAVEKKGSKPESERGDVEITTGDQAFGVKGESVSGKKYLASLRSSLSPKAPDNEF